MYILDTNIISAVRRSERMPQVKAWLNNKAEQELFLSVITLGEIERGIYRKETENPEFALALRKWLNHLVYGFKDRILPFGASEARIWGQLSAKLGHNGADLLIAATALHHDAIIVTRNEKDFLATGVKLENPF